MGNLLRRYIRMLIEETELARVPTQLLSPDEENGSVDNDDDEGIEEFSGAGAIAGYTGPLGIDPDALGRKKNAGSKSRKRDR
jgi:hypothetical protein